MQQEKLSLIAQRFFLIAALIVTIGPVWMMDYFHTGDGAAHIYSAHVLSDLLFHPHSVFHQFFDLNLLPVPNAIIQIILVPLLALFSSATANKILVSLIILLFLYGYIYLQRTLSHSLSYSFAVLLLVFCFPIKMGLYSLIAGLGMMMFSLGYYIKSEGSFSFKRIIFFSVLVTVTWFFHLFACMSLMLLLFIYEVISLLKHIQRKQSPGLYIKEKLPVLISFIPVFLLAILFSGKAIDATATKFADWNSLVEWFTDFTVMHFFHTEWEGTIRTVFKVLLLFSVVLLIVKGSKYQNFPFAFMITSMIAITVLFFVMPMNFLSGGLINLRFSYLLLIFFCLLIDMIIAEGWLLYVKNGVVVTCCLILSVNVYKNMQPYSERLGELLTAADHIDNGAVIVPLNYTDENFEYNFSLYLSCDKNCVVLDNAEAASPNGLVVWKKNIWKPELIGNYLESNNPVIHPGEYLSKTGVAINYILQWKWKESMNDSATVSVNALLNSSYTLVFASAMNNARLWKKSRTVLIK